jgi:hypothetical protein
MVPPRCATELRAAGLITRKRAAGQDPLAGRVSALAASFDVAKPIMGVVHLRPLPGAPSYDGEDVRHINAARVANTRLEIGTPGGTPLEHEALAAVD